MNYLWSEIEWTYKGGKKITKKENDNKEETKEENGIQKERAAYRGGFLTGSAAKHNGDRVNRG